MAKQERIERRQPQAYWLDDGTGHVWRQPRPDLTDREIDESLATAVANVERGLSPLGEPLSDADVISQAYDCSLDAAEFLAGCLSPTAIANVRRLYCQTPLA